METQTIWLDTVIGLKSVKAPAGYDFDKTGKLVWSRLLALTDKFKVANSSHRALKSEKVALAAQRRVLANILANAYGMSDFFWEQVSNELCD